jgi:hypothetical protein
MYIGLVNQLDALDFIEKHGVVLESGKGSVRNLVDAVAGRALNGNWWSSPRGKTIFRVTREVRDAPDVLTCRLLDGRVTFVHRRLWAALVRLAPLLDTERLSAVRESHAKNGSHKVVETRFPEWVPDEVRSEARRLTAEQALEELGSVLGLEVPNRSLKRPPQRAAR